MLVRGTEKGGWKRGRERGGERGKKRIEVPTGFSLMMPSAFTFAAADMAGETLEAGKKRRRNEMVGEKSEMSLRGVRSQE